MLGFLNTKIAFEYLTAYNPTINLLTTDICNLPLLISENFYQEISTLVDRCVSLSLQEWDSFETSWDFKAHPLAPLAYERKEQLKARMHSEERWKSVSLLSDRYERWELECENRFKRLKENEEELNRIFIDIYGLQDELTPDVEDKDVTVRKADKQRDIRSLISYAVGCMFGRYSLDTAGLAYAGGEWEANKYQTFIPDNDNVIPITDEEYFEDDIVGLFCAWLKKVYGKDTLEDNLDYIAEALGNRGNTSREVIRNYFLNDFFKDHCKLMENNAYKNTIVITNRKMVEGSLLHQLQRIAVHHPYAMILRETDLQDAEYEALAKETMKICAQAKTLFFLHSRIALARKLGCPNIHLPLALLKDTDSFGIFHQGTKSPGRFFERISVSCHSVEDMRTAVALGATQIVLGTIFATESKKGVAGRGLGFVREVCEACPVPVYAIGGITTDNLAAVQKAGAAGGCMMSGFMKMP